MESPPAVTRIEGEEDELDDLNARIAAKLQVSAVDTNMTEAIATEESSDNKIKIIYDPSAALFRPNRMPVDENEWKEISLLRWEDALDIRADDFFCKLDGKDKCSWSDFYLWMSENESRFFEPQRTAAGTIFERNHIRAQIPIIRDPKTKTNRKDFDRIAAIGISNEYAVIAATEHDRSPIDHHPLLETDAQLEEKKKKRLKKSKFYLYRCSLLQDEFRTEIVRLIEPKSRGSTPNVEARAKKIFEAKIEDCTPCYQLVEDSRLPGPVLLAAISGDGMTAIICMTEEEQEKNEIDRHAHRKRRVNIFDTHKSLRLGSFALPEGSGLPDMLGCSDAPHYLAVVFNQASGNVEVAGTVQPPEEETHKLPPHVVIYDISNWRTHPVPLSCIYVPVSGGQEALKGDDGDTVVNQITGVSFNDKGALCVCTTDGAVHVLTLATTLEGSLVYSAELIPSLEEPPEALFRKKPAEEGERGDEGDRNVNLAKMDHPNSDGDGVVNLVWRHLRHNNETRLLASTFTKMIIHSGHPSQREEKLARGKISQWTSPPVGTCASIGTCGNLLVTHNLTTNNIYFGNLCTLRDTKIFDDAALLSEMEQAHGPYRSIKVFSRRFYVLYPNGVLAAFLPNDDKFQQQYNEEKKKALEERNVQETKRAQVRIAVETARKKQAEEEAAKNASKHADPVVL